MTVLRDISIWVEIHRRQRQSRHGAAVEWTLLITIDIGGKHAIDHVLNDVIPCRLLQLPECIAYSLSNKVIKLLVYWQSILHFSGFLIEFQSFLSNHVLVVFLVCNEDVDILMDIAQCILGVVVTGIE